MQKNSFGKLDRHSHSKQHERDDEIFVDKDGIPYWDGQDLSKLNEYESRVELEFDNLELEPDEAKRKKLQVSLGLSLLRELTGKAWRALKPHQGAELVV